MISGSSIAARSDRILVRRAMPSRPNGGGGIRTHGRLSPTTVFKTVPIDHSGTPPIGLTYCPPLTSSRMSSATKIGTSTVTARAIASLGRESTSTSSPSWRIRNLAKYVCSRNSLM